MVSSTRSAEKEAFWRLALEEHRGSGLTVRAFCRREGISEPSFYAWRRRIAKGDANSGRGALQPGLIPVKIVDPVGDDSPRGDEPSARRLEVVTPSGFTLRFHHDIEPRQLDTLLHVISRCEGAMPC